MLAPTEPAPAGKPPAVPSPKTRTITLTNRAPIQIVEDEWPIVAQGMCGIEPGGPYEWDIAIRVRIDKHQRTIIHAHYRYSCDEHWEDSQTVRVGRLLHWPTPDVLWKNILEVGEELRSRIGWEKLRPNVTYAVDNCFAQLPAHVI